jgi:hypothetical protein
VVPTEKASIGNEVLPEEDQKEYQYVFASAQART